MVGYTYDMVEILDYTWVLSWQFQELLSNINHMNGIKQNH